MSEEQKQRPFPESIVIAISESKTVGTLMSYARLILATKVPCGHEEIAAAIRRKQEELGDTVGISTEHLLRKTIEELNRQKVEA